MDYSNRIEQIHSSVQRGIDNYNKELGSDWIFALYKIPGFTAKAESDPEFVHFFIKETDCLKSENKKIEECAFQDKGEEHCSVAVSAKEDMNSVPVCNNDMIAVPRGRKVLGRIYCSRPGSCSPF
ncbi:cathelicidin-related peptide Oh-Cath-like [Xenopus laevis]|uniref:Cathelicidin-related peptide Oh-Cath-like n=1 Tax=Xenopus laevis TaxID=8355 RepID=A0A8J1KZI4_XENLA|nr:cathelicidin-related peptide Oh-Cath-like [Xenopus laevis]